jgi:triosephosphate isomerase
MRKQHKQQANNMFIINCKNYDEISGEKINKIARIAEKISKKHKIQIAIAPPHHQLALIKKSKLLVFAQHLDDAKIGSTTGYMIPEIVKKSKVNGALINHSEHRISPTEITNLVKRLKKLKMKTVVCVKNVREAEKYAKLNPTYIAIEPPELIGTGRAISTERPGLITKSLSAVKKARNSTKLLCGAGIVTSEDVKRAMELGSRGILVASGIVKSRNWQKDIEGFAKAIL